MSKTETEPEKIINYFFTNLDTLAKLYAGSKIYINDQNIITIDEPYMFQGLWRYCNNISRKDAIYVITKLFNDIETYFSAQFVKYNVDPHNQLKLSKMPEFIVKLFQQCVEKLNKALKGLDSLTITYEADSEICLELTKLKSKAKSIISNLESMVNRRGF
jgi:hypothetical protein